MIHVEWEHMYWGVDVITTYHTVVSKLNINMWSMLDNIQVSKRANGGGSLMWSDIVAIGRD